MDNKSIAGILYETADLLEIDAQDSFRIRSYRNAAEAIEGLTQQISEIISEPKQVIWAYDQDAWARQLDYATVPLELAKRLYVASRDGVIHYAAVHYDHSQDIPFVHSETGARTLKDEFDKVVWHNENHLGQIERALRAGHPE